MGSLCLTLREGDEVVGVETQMRYILYALAAFTFLLAFALIMGSAKDWRKW